MDSHNKQEIAICCITDKSKGFGNLNRCITLAKSLRRKFNIVFIITRNKSAINELKKRKFQHVTISKVLPLSEYSKEVYNIISKRKCETLIIDMREYGQEISQKFRSTNLKTILLDDAWSRKAYADLIINGTNVKKYHKYQKINKKSKLFLGPKFWIIDKDFRINQKKISQIVNKKQYHVIISVGGADPNRITLKVIRSLLHVKNIKMTVIVGSFFEHVQDIIKLSKTNKNIHVKFSPKKIWKEFLKGDLVISGAGNTLFELAVQRIPTICISTVKHQISYGEEFSSKGFAIDLGFWKKVKLGTIKDVVIKTLENDNKRRSMSRKAEKIIDGKGLPRVVKILEQFLNKV